VLYDCATIESLVCILLYANTVVVCMMQVYGALMWGIGRSFKHKSEVPKVYVGSFWDGSKHHPDRYAVSVLVVYVI
jgi:hypothetical protein